LHHVIYGMCTWREDYFVPLWYNPKSHFSYLIVAKYGLERLMQIYQEAMKSKLQTF
jgi:S-adenosylmethionine:tRNA-ribosyltransferase-isomerase (queuine synthetase)